MGSCLGMPRKRWPGCVAALCACALTVTLGCGGSSTASAPPAAAAKNAEPAEQAPVDAGVPVPAASRSTATIRGLQGTLNHDDVMQAMEARQEGLLACIETGRRSINFVNGDIHFEFKVDAEGKAVDVRATRSNIGHLELETCLTDVLAQTSFPKPAGRSLTKDLSWEMGVDAAYREATPIDGAQLASLLERRTESLYDACELPRRYQYTVTSYFTKGGKARTAGAVVTKGGAEARQHVPCVVEQVRKWRFPKAKRRTKVTYPLKFQKAPSDKEIRARKKREAAAAKREAKREAKKRKAERARKRRANKKKRKKRKRK